VRNWPSKIDLLRRMLRWKKFSLMNSNADLARKLSRKRDSSRTTFKAKSTKTS
jgi:hypothetical protein